VESMDVRMNGLGDGIVDGAVLIGSLAGHVG